MQHKSALICLKKPHKYLFRILAIISLLFLCIINTKQTVQIGFTFKLILIIILLLLHVAHRQCDYDLVLHDSFCFYIPAFPKAGFFLCKKYRFYFSKFFIYRQQLAFKVKYMPKAFFTFYYLCNLDCQRFQWINGQNFYKVILLLHHYSALLKWFYTFV